MDHVYENKELNEFSPYEVLFKKWSIVNDYGESAMRAKEMKPFFKNKEELCCRECNAPGKLPAIYIISYDKRTKRHTYMPFLVVEGSEGRSFVAREGMDTTCKDLIIIRSHAVSRYIKRHGWDGTREDCERYLLTYMWVTSREQDPITKEFVEYFDEGIFMGRFSNHIYYTNTYQANQHLYPNQRFASIRLQKHIEEFFEDLDKNGLTNPVKNFNILKP